jgi:hypothetical protein
MEHPDWIAPVLRSVTASVTDKNKDEHRRHQMGLETMLLWEPLLCHMGRRNLRSGCVMRMVTVERDEDVQNRIRLTRAVD